MSEFIDLSHELSNNFPVFPGNSPTYLIQENSFDEDGYNSYRLEINMHTGTHIDSPNHMVQGARMISEMPLSHFTGKAVILDVQGESPIPFKEEYRTLIPSQGILLLHTGHSTLFNTPAYYNDYPVLEPAWIPELIAKQIKILGVDSPSPDKAPYQFHKELFPHEILFLENLTNLHQLLKTKSIEIFAFPIRIQAAASILRVVAKIN